MREGGRNVLRFIWYEHQITIFSIADTVYYFTIEAGVATIYDGTLNRQLIANLDNWFQHHTQQLYSYQTFQLARYAFVDAMALHQTVGQESLVQILNWCFRKLIASGLWRDYVAVYWIEAISYPKIEKFITHCRTQWSVSILPSLSRLYYSLASGSRYQTSLASLAAHNQIAIPESNLPDAGGLHKQLARCLSDGLTVRVTTGPLLPTELTTNLVNLAKLLGTHK